ncbi:MAG: spondin domain-containing protein [Acidobacteria bacterium]|nr:spondin domain-containing protein [Acidobacteriota bacterium]
MRKVFVLSLLMAFAASHSRLEAQSNARYSVTVTNLTKGQTFTPLIFATHTPAVRIFAPGTQASPQLQVLAEEGDPAMLAALLRGMTAEVREVVVAPNFLSPAVTATFQIMSGGAFSQLSVAAMLIPTNDAFAGLSGLTLPMGFDPVVVDLLAYDSGTEINDERCASIPGPSFAECGGPGGGARAGRGEGAVTVHNGMHGVGDMTRPLRDWRGPVARVTVQRVQ